MSDRAVSTSLNYSLTLAISTLLVVGLLTAGGTFVDQQREGVVDSELRVIGERLASDLAAADRLAQVGGGSAVVNVTSRLPRSVSGKSYTVAVTGSGGNATLVLSPNGENREVSVPVANKTAISPTRVSSGNLRIVYDDAGDGTLEVTND
ncbi:hypothetical protein ACKVMT_01520 [Halobacteriales archaeon Cl-PHB]